MTNYTRTLDAIIGAAKLIESYSSDDVARVAVSELLAAFDRLSPDGMREAAHAELSRQGGYYRSSDDTAHLDGSFDIRRLVEAIINGGER